MTIPQKAILATVACVLAIVIGTCFWRETPERHAPNEQVLPQMLEALRKARARGDSFEKARTLLQAKVDGTTVRAIAATNRIATGSVPEAHLPEVRILGPGTLGDTTQWSWVMRKDDSTHYASPLFFVETYEWLKSAFYDVRALHDYDSTYTIPGYRLTIGVQDSIIGAERADKVFWHNAFESTRHPRCGTKCKVLGGAASAEFLRRWIQSVARR